MAGPQCTGLQKLGAYYSPGLMTPTPQAKSLMEKTRSRSSHGRQPARFTEPRKSLSTSNLMISRSGVLKHSQKTEKLLIKYQAENLECAQN